MLLKWGCASAPHHGEDDLEPLTGHNVEGLIVKCAPRSSPLLLIRYRIRIPSLRFNRPTPLTGVRFAPRLLERGDSARHLVRLPPPPGQHFLSMILDGHSGMCLAVRKARLFSRNVSMIWIFPFLECAAVVSVRLRFQTFSDLRGYSLSHHVRVVR